MPQNPATGSGLQVEWRALGDLTPIAAQWQDLARRALAPNVFYEPAFALAALPVFGSGVGAGLVWSRDTPARLLGFFPARVERRRYGLPLPMLVGWTHPYAPLGSPLIDGAAGDDVIAGWLDHVAGNDRLPKLMLLPCLPQEGPLASAFDRALARRGAHSVGFARHARALLAPVPRPAHRDRDYLERAVTKKKRKELRRQRNRLAEIGRVASVSAQTPAQIASALDAFFTLEASGWKGRARTAARSQPAITRFMTAAVTALAQERQAQILRLELDDRAIAAVVILRSGSGAWCWKIAYDESWARFSPGVQVMLDATAMLLAEPGIAWADSCATPDHPMIDHLWRERLVLADRLIGLEPGRTFAFRAACAREAWSRRARDAAKALLRY